ncbi:hypothetical protein DDZ13_06485 [Coraliomargarita sinensis]|uniref:VapC45 PIN like domain-containing protein n=1 Tax=Coraliomargarita sinensis TaxID=2174842 RepID=A0A317ZKV8_9BACT|nr:hypothetical protein DDZ13_06485 [Coraliomargarita sinensis]
MSESQPKTPLWLFFDECMSPRVEERLREFYQHDYAPKCTSSEYDFRTLHLTDFTRAGEDDPEWLQKLGDEPDWVVVSVDYGRDRKKPRLPLLCEELGRTYVLLSPDLRPYLRQKQSLVEVWRMLKLVPFLPKGSRVKLRPRNIKGDVKVFQLVVYSPGKRDNWELIHQWCSRNEIPLAPIQ